jgi:hypothetical protein
VLRQPWQTRGEVYMTVVAHRGGASGGMESPSAHFAFLIVVGITPMTKSQNLPVSLTVSRARLLSGTVWTDGVFGSLHFRGIEIHLIK